MTKLYSLLTLVVLQMACGGDTEPPSIPSPHPNKSITITNKAELPALIPTRGDNFTIQLSAKDAWFIATYYMDEVKDWVTASPMWGNAGEDIPIRIGIGQNLSSSDRLCFLRIMAKDSQESIEIRQSQQNVINVSPSQHTLDAGECEFSIRIQANIDFTAEPQSTWIKSVGNRNATTQTFRAEANTGETRIGTILVTGGGVSATIEVKQFEISDIIHIPDPKFKSCILQYDITGDGEISEQEASLATSISCSNQGISSLKGIEYFTSITSLNFSNNNVSELDLSHNTRLESLNSRFNPLEWINMGETLPTHYTGGYSWSDTPHFEALTSTSFTIISSKITKLGVHSEMSSRWDNINLQVIDISGCSALKNLSCFAGNPKLKEVWLKQGQDVGVWVPHDGQIFYK